MAESTGEYGGFWIRFLAYIADCAILFVAMVALAFVFGVTGMVLIGNIVLFLVVLLYWPAMQASARQATFGKAMLGLKVGDGEGERISFLRSFARELAKNISALVFMVGFVMAAFTAKKQALHDLLASTTVVRAGDAHIGRAVAVSVAGFVVPIVAIAVLGVAAFGGMLGEDLQDMQGQMRREMEKQQAEAMRKAAPPPAPAAPLPPPAAPVATQPPASPVAAAPPPKPVAEPPPPPKPVAEPAPQPKPAPAEVAVERPAPRLAPPPEPPPPPSAAAARLAALPEAPPLPGPERRSAPVASALKYNDVMSAVMARDAGAVEQLLKMGRWADKADRAGMTPLMVAAQNGDARSAELLLKAGANPNLSVAGQTASSLAQQRGEFAMVDLLQRYGAR